MYPRQGGKPQAGYRVCADEEWKAGATSSPYGSCSILAARKASRLACEEEVRKIAAAVAATSPTTTPVALRPLPPRLYILLVVVLLAVLLQVVLLVVLLQVVVLLIFSSTGKLPDIKICQQNNQWLDTSSAIMEKRFTDHFKNLKYF